MFEVVKKFASIVRGALYRDGKFREERKFFLFFIRTHEPNLSRSYATSSSMAQAHEGGGSNGFCAK